MNVDNILLLFELAQIVALNFLKNSSEFFLNLTTLKKILMEAFVKSKTT